MKRLFLIPLAGSIAFFSACNSGPKVNTAELNEALKNDGTEEKSQVEESAIQVDPAEINQIINSIPSPLQIGFLIKETGGEYNRNYLNPPNKLDQYDNSYSKALNLGIYGADLAYTNIYNQKADGGEYLSAVRGLAEDLSIDKFFELSTITRLIKNNDNLDSLLMITTSNFEKINLYLQENNRSHLSTLLLTGGWIEGLSLICSVNDYNSNKELQERIGEQKITLDQLLHLLSYYEKDAKIKPLINKLKELESVYKGIEIVTIEGESSFEEIDGIMMIVDNSYTEVIITDEQVKEIGRVIKEIRKSIIN